MRVCVFACFRHAKDVYTRTGKTIIILAMSLSLRLNDDQYPYHGFEHIRQVARGIVLDEDGKVLIHLIHRNDQFGDQIYYETPGGGVDEGETYEDAVMRECEEELGAEIEIIGYLGEVIDAYNLIKRQNINRFFLCKIKGKKAKHYESAGDLLIQKTVRLDLDEAIALYEAMDKTLVSGLVRQRELPFLKEAKRILGARK